MNLIYDVYLILALSRRICYLLPYLPYIVNTIVGCGINLDHIHGSARCDSPAGFTFPAGISVHRMLTVHGSRQDLRHCGLSRSPRPAEQICMAETVRCNLVFQGCHNMVLPLHICEGVRAKFTV